MAKKTAETQVAPAGATPAVQPAQSPSSGLVGPSVSATTIVPNRGLPATHNQPQPSTAIKAAPPVAVSRPSVVEDDDTDVMERSGLHHAKLEIMKQVSYIRKKQPDKKNTSAIKYSYASEEDIVDALHDAMIDNGLTVTPIGVEVIKSAEFKTKNGAIMNHVMLLVRYRLTCADSGEYEDAVVTGEGMDTGDKSCNKAMTSAYKYFFRQSFVIPTGDDPDRVPSDEMEREPPESESFKRCRDALGKAKDEATLDRYCEIYRSGRGYTEAEIKKLDQEYARHKEEFKKRRINNARPLNNQAATPQAQDDNGEEGEYQEEDEYQTEDTR